MGYGMNNSQTPQTPYTATGGQKEKIPKGYKKYNIANYTDNQMKLHDQGFAHVGPDSYLNRLAGGDEELFNEMEAPAFRQFQGLQGQLASRFSGAGMGGRHGSAFQNAANQQTSEFAQDLQSKRQGYMQQALRDLMGFSDQILNQKPYETGLTEKAKPWWQEALTSFAGGAGKTTGAAAGKYFGGLFG